MTKVWGNDGWGCFGGMDPLRLASRPLCPSDISPARGGNRIGVLVI